MVVRVLGGGARGWTGEERIGISWDRMVGNGNGPIGRGGEGADGY